MPSLFIISMTVIIVTTEGFSGYKRPEAEFNPKALLYIFLVSNMKKSYLFLQTLICDALLRKHFCTTINWVQLIYFHVRNLWWGVVHVFKGRLYMYNDITRETVETTEFWVKLMRWILIHSLYFGSSSDTFVPTSYSSNGSKY